MPRRENRRGVVTGDQPRTGLRHFRVWHRGLRDRKRRQNRVCHRRQNKADDPSRELYPKALHAEDDSKSDSPARASAYVTARVALAIS